MTNVTVRYYAVLREQAGLNVEFVETKSSSIAGLYAELSQRYRFSLESDSLRVAVNNEFAEWSSSLCDGDTVVFIPPVAGG